MNLKKIISIILTCTFILQVSVSDDAREQSKRFLKSMKAEDYFELSGQLELAKAIESSDLDKIIVLLNDDEVDPNYKNKDQMTSLYWALLKDKKDSFEVLLEQGANPNLTLESDRPKYETISILRLASIHEDPFFLEQLLLHGGDVNMKLSPSSDRTILYIAMLNRRDKNIEVLIENGAEINRQSAISGNTALIDSVYAGSYEMALKLLELGADPTIKNIRGDDVASILEAFKDRGVAKGSKQHDAYLELTEIIKP